MKGFTQLFSDVRVTMHTLWWHGEYIKKIYEQEEKNYAKIVANIVLLGFNNNKKFLEYIEDD